VLVGETSTPNGRLWASDVQPCRFSLRAAGRSRLQLFFGVMANKDAFYGSIPSGGYGTAGCKTRQTLEGATHLEENLDEPRQLVGCTGIHEPLKAIITRWQLQSLSACRFARSAGRLQTEIKPPPTSVGAVFFELTIDKTFKVIEPLQAACGQFKPTARSPISPLDSSGNPLDVAVPEVTEVEAGCWPFRCRPHDRCGVAAYWSTDVVGNRRLIRCC
jgi:hypothetical protein